MLANRGPLKRYLMRINMKRFTGTPINVPLNVPAAHQDELLAEIERHLPKPHRNGREAKTD